MELSNIELNMPLDNNAPNFRTKKWEFVYFKDNNPTVLVEFHGYDIKGEWKTTESKVKEIMKSYKYKEVEKIQNKIIFKK